MVFNQETGAKNCSNTKLCQPWARVKKKNRGNTYPLASLSIPIHF